MFWDVFLPAEKNINTGQHLITLVTFVFYKSEGLFVLSTKEQVITLSQCIRQLTNHTTFIFKSVDSKCSAVLLCHIFSMFCFMICQMCPTGRPAQHPNSSSVNYSTIYHKIDAVCGLGFITDGVFPKVQADSSPSYHHPFKRALARGDPHHRWLKSVPVHDSRSFTGCCRHSLLHFSRYLLCIC